MDPFKKGDLVILKSAIDKFGTEFACSDVIGFTPFVGGLYIIGDIAKSSCSRVGCWVYLKDARTGEPISVYGISHNQVEKVDEEPLTQKVLNKIKKEIWGEVFKIDEVLDTDDWGTWK